MSMVDVLGLDEEQLQGIGIHKLRALINDEGLWFDRRLRVMQERLKLLGAYPKPEPVKVDVNQNNDNRSVMVLIQAPDHARSSMNGNTTSGRIIEGEIQPLEVGPVALGEFMRGILVAGEQTSEQEVNVG